MEGSTINWSDLFTRTTEHSSIGVIVVDVDTLELLYANDVSFRLLNKKRTAYNYMKCCGVFFDSAMPCKSCKLSQHGKLSARQIIHDKAADRILSLETEYTSWHSRNLAIEYITDITDRSKAEQALTISEQSVTNKKNMLTQLSHDVRTPLNSVLNFSRFINETDSLTSAKMLSEKILASGTYLQMLINDMLELNEVSSNNFNLNPEPYLYVDFIPVLRNIVESTAVEKGIDLQFIAPMQESVPIMIDKLRLQQIFVNILSNAIKFTPAGGRIIMQTDLFNQSKRNETIHFRVMDNGIGISEEFLPHIFEPFTQENHGQDNNHNGIGLGLTIAQKLIKKMGGTITCESKPDKGTTFIVDIPVITAPPPPIRASHKQSVRELLQNKRIMICEDNMMNQEIIAHLLAPFSCQLELAKNGMEGFIKYKNSLDNPFDLILMDIRMPIMDGLETTRRIKRLEEHTNTSVPIIAVTANAYQHDIEECLSVGMKAHIAKPIIPKVMYETISDVLANFAS